MQLIDNPYLFWTLLIGSNIFMYLCTILISYMWSKIYNHKTLKLTRQDMHNSLVVLAINVLVAIPGYLLLTNARISFTTSSNLIRDFILLFLVFDLTMYVLHIISHYVWPFKKFHNKHHTHEYFNIISLYVMEPIECLLFGTLLTICTYVMELNIYGFLGFLFLNWILGVIGHLNTKSTKQPFLFGNHVFHKAHHQEGDKNFGFYTVIWDKIFGTFYRKNS